MFEDFEPGADLAVEEGDLGYFPYDVYLYYSDSAPYPDEEYKGKSPFVTAVRASTGSVEEGGEYVPNAPNRAADRSLWEAWVVDNGNGGRGEWVEFDLAYADEVKEVCLVGGDPAMRSPFRARPAPRPACSPFRRLVLHPGIGRRTRAQRFPVDARDVTSARLEIVDSYPGTQSDALFPVRCSSPGSRPRSSPPSRRLAEATPTTSTSSTTSTTAASTTVTLTTSSSVSSTTATTTPASEPPSTVQDRWFRSPIVWGILGVALVATLLGWLIVRQQDRTSKTGPRARSAAFLLRTGSTAGRRSLSNVLRKLYGQREARWLDSTPDWNFGSTSVPTSDSSSGRPPSTPASLRWCARRSRVNWRGMRAGVAGSCWRKGSA